MGDATRVFPLLGGSVTVTLYDVEPTLAALAFEETYREGRRLQRIFNLYDPESELSKLNRRRELRASEELRLVLAVALRFGRLTRGAYDVSKGSEFLARKRGEEVRVGCTYEDIEIDGDIIRLIHPDVLVDLGSIAKGYIGDALIDFIRGIGVEGAFVDARGDMRVYGPRLEVVEIRHPRQPGAAVGAIVLEEAAVATSGDYKQFASSFDRSHIVGAKDFASVSVVARTLMEADAIATALFVLGSGMAKALLHQFPHVRVLAIDRALRRFSYNGFEELALAEQTEEGRDGA
jgi:thiamine biosynthesis lipoprotein